MKVFEFAKELNMSSDFILEALRSLKLKAIDKDQPLNVVVISILRGELSKHEFIQKIENLLIRKKSVKPGRKKATTIKKKTVKTEDEAVTKKKVVKKTVKKVVKKAVKDIEPKVVQPAVTQEDIKPQEEVVPEVSAVVKETVKEVFSPKETSKRKISKEPMVALKPLSRKRKRLSNKDEVKTNLVEKGDAITAESSSLGSLSEFSTVDIPEGELPELEIQVPITVKDFSSKVGQKPSMVLKKLMLMGLFCHINQGLEGEIVEKLTKEFGYNLVSIKTQEEKLIESHKEAEDDPSQLEKRAPVITFMGHVDHGKTSLLDRIRESKIADKEHGGITQHMGAYSVEIPKGRITFMDTPGHEAFTAMRARGAHITDIVILVVAADEGIMPQTREAIDHARAADVPIVVAMNKIDRPNADPDRLKQQLAEVDLAPEDWGGKTIVVGVSAMTGEGIDNLLEMILLEAEMLELKANPNKTASGIVVEAHLSQGKGAVTSLIVQSGTLHKDDYVVVGPYYGKMRALFNDLKQNMDQAGPSMPVEVLGLSNVPEAGEMFYVVEDEAKAREITIRRQQEMKEKRLNASQRVTLEGLYSQLQEGAVKELNVIVKSDVQGSLEALKDSLEKIPSEKVRIRFIHCGVGDVNASDVILAVASNAIVIAFHVGMDSRARTELEKTPVDVREYRIIYDAVNDMRKALEGLLEAKINKNFTARVEIREVFKLTKQGVVAGCYVQKGKVYRKSHVDVMRDEETVFSGKISSLKRFKDDVKEVTEGMECGITVGGFDKIQKGDMLEVYEVQSVVQKL